MQWAAAYLAGAWVVVESSNLVVERFNWPEAIGQAVIIAALFGFLLTLVVAWYHGEKGRQRVSGPELVAVAVLLVAGGVAISRVGSDEETAQVNSPEIIPAMEDNKPSIAVLPFRNLSPEPDDSYFSDGMQEEILSKLAAVSSLRVKSGSSVERFRGNRPSGPEIAADLGVEFLLEGSARIAGGLVRVSVRLVHGQTDEQLLSEEFDREYSVEHVIEVQHAIAREVASQLEVVIAPEEAARIAAVPTEHPEAYLACQNGLYALRQRSSLAIGRAIQQFSRAIELDSTFAKPYAGLSFAYCVQALNYLRPTREVADSARLRANQAVELDSTLAEGYLALGCVKYRFDWDLKGAEEAFRQAILLNYLLIDAYTLHAQILAMTDRGVEAVSMAQKATEIDPLALLPKRSLARALAQLGAEEEAIRVHDEIVEIWPDWPLVMFEKGQIFDLLGKSEEAAEIYRTIVAEPEIVSGDLDTPAYQAWMAQALGKAGYREEAVEILSQLIERRSAGEYVQSDAIAWVYNGLGQPEDALAWLYRAYDEREHGLVLLNLPTFNDLHGNPRFEELRQRVLGDFSGN